MEGWLDLRGARRGGRGVHRVQKQETSWSSVNARVGCAAGPRGDVALTPAHTRDGKEE